MTDTLKVGDWLLFYSVWKGYTVVQVTKITPTRYYGEFPYGRRFVSRKIKGVFSSEKVHMDWLATTLNSLAKKRKEALAAVYAEYKEREKKAYAQVWAEQVFDEAMA